MPVKVNASMLCIPIDWATKDEPQMIAVMRRRIIPIGFVRRIAFPFWSGSVLDTWNAFKVSVLTVTELFRWYSIHLFVLIE